MKKSLLEKTLLILTLLIFVGLASCQKESITSEEVSVEPTQDMVITVPEIEGHNHAIHNHVESQPVYTSSVEEVTRYRPDGTVEELLLVDGDIEMTRKQFLKLESENADPIKQYRTSNLVSSPRTISVIGYTKGGNKLTSKMQTALTNAVANYNALNIGLNFTLSFSGNTNADIVVYKVGGGGAGGSAGFPSSGNPYKWVQILRGTNNYSTDVVEHVMTHEIGHCVGLRHTDYFSRASCGENSNEGSAGIGAIQIPGTPSGIDWNSIMLACFTSSEDGEFWQL